MKPGKNNKRGSIADILLVLIVLGFTLGIVNIISFKFYNSFYATAYPLMNSSNTSAAALNTFADQESLFDYFFLAVMVGLIIVGYVLAFMSRQSPAFVWINLIVIFILVIVGVIMSNAYETISNDPELASIAASFPIQNYVFTNLPVIMTAAIAGMLLVMYIVGSNDAAY